jgi:hypothetical protein
MRNLYLLLLPFSLLSTISAQNLIPIQKGDQWGYCNDKMEIVIPAQYSAAYPFYENRALVEIFNYEDDKNEHKACFIDEKGKAIFCWEVFAQAFPATRFQDGIALIENFEYSGYQQEPMLAVVDSMGGILLEIKGAALDFNLSMYYTYGEAFNSSGIYATTCIQGDSMGSVLIYKDLKAPKYLPYQYVNQFKDGVSIAVLQPSADEEGYPTALINEAGDVLIPARKYKMIPNYDSDTYGGDGLIPVEQEGKFGYINIKGDLVIPFQYDNARSFSEGMAAVGKIVDEDEYGSPIYSWGYINRKGELLIDYQYKDAFTFSEGMAEVTKGNMLQFIDKSGAVQFEFPQKEKTDESESPYLYGSYVYHHGFKDGLAIVYVDDQVGWIDKKGEFIIPPYYWGLGRIGPSTLVIDFDEHGLTRVAHPDGPEIYIDKTEKQYYTPTANLLSKRDRRIAAYSSINPPTFADSLYQNSSPQLLEIIRKGNWLKIKHYNPEFQYVKAEDFYHQVVLSNQQTTLYQSPKDKDPILTLPPKHRFYLADGEKKSKVKRKNKWIKVVFYGEDPISGDYQNQEFYMKSNQIDLLKLD